MERVAILGGCRTPFAPYHAELARVSAIDLAAVAVRGLLKRVTVHADEIDELIWGTVHPPLGVPNFAREITLRALSAKVVGVTMSHAGLSSIRAITAACDALDSYPEKIFMAGGSESLSNMPIAFPDRLTQRLYTKHFARSKFRKFVNALKWHPGDYFPQIPEFVEPSTGMTLDQYGERVARLFTISREEQDRWAMRSRQKAAAGGGARLETEPVETGDKKNPTLTADSGVGSDESIERLGALPPLVDPAGTLTSGNSAKPADGACALLLTSERNARRLGYEPKAFIKSYSYAALPPDDEMLLGPALSIPSLLLQTGVAFRDIDVVEMHEASAAQALANMRALGSKDFLTRHNQILAGQIDIDEARVNAAGGTLACGHPFGATGARLMLQCTRRLIDNGGGLGLVTAGGAGGQGVAVLLEGITR
ncbi:MAG: thiolase family protein [Acidobacteriota bacterium]